MLKVLIADDEERICMLIEKLIDWDSMDMKIVAYASNGMEAYQKINEYNPDIVITDIRMPGYDGIELIKKCRNERSMPEFIIISGYRHFEYAQSAIKYGVSDYLLKPIKKTELKQTLEEIRETFLQKSEREKQELSLRTSLKTNRETLRAAYFSGLLFRTARQDRVKDIESINQEYAYSFSPGLWAISVIKFGGKVLSESRIREFLFERIKVLVKERIGDYTYDMEVYEHTHFIYVLLNFDSDKYISIRKEMKLILDDVLIKKTLFEDLSISISMGLNVESPNSLAKSLKNASLLIEESLIVGENRIIEGEVKEGIDFAYSNLFEELNRNFIKTLESLSGDKVSDFIWRLKNELLAIEDISGHEILQMTKEICNLYILFQKGMGFPVKDFFLEEYNFGADSCTSVDSLFEYLNSVIRNSFDRLCTLKRSMDNKPIRLAKQYIEENYASQISIEAVSEYVGLSPTYFSSVFKKDTGMTFLEYLSGTRMEIAKTLLKDTTLPVSAICKSVGYSDVRHFTKLFTKYTALKPNEYRKIYA